MAGLRKSLHAKILICNELIDAGGLGTYTLSLAQGLKNRDWEINILVTHGAGEHYGGTKKFAQRCYDLSSMPLSLRKLKVAKDIVMDVAPDILLLNHCSLMHYVLPYLVPGIKPVAILHNDTDLLFRVASLYDKRIFRWIAPSQALAQHFLAYIESDYQKRIRIIQHGVDTGLFFESNRTTDSKIVKISFIGHIGENKGADILPDIIELVVKRYASIDVTIAGHGEMRSLLEHRFKEKKVPVRLLGYIRPETVSDVLRNTDILVLPTRVEGFGLIIIEAMLCGVVPVVSRLDGITTNIVQHGVTGYLPEMNDIKGFADSIIGLIERPELLRQMSSNAVADAQNRFSLLHMIEEYEKIFSEDDDRTSVGQRGKVGWLIETASEIIKKKQNKRKLLMFKPSWGIAR
jgi:glycosyltransferase involved in cell wall biosynthesis